MDSRMGNRIGRGLALLAVGMLVGCGQGENAFAMGEAAYKAPFDVPAPTSSSSATSSRAGSCPAVGQPLVSLAVNTRYAPGKTADKVSDEAEAEYKEAMAPVISFMASTSNQANRYIRSNGAALDGANCARDALAVWANANALTQVSGTAGWFKQSTLLSGLSLIYLQIRDAPTDAAGRAKNRQIEQWLGRLGAMLLQFRRTGVQGSPVHNNHLYWAGLALGASGAAIGNREFFDFGMSALKEGACSITPQGFLPMELKRGRASLHYHVYALQPLMLLAELAERNHQPGLALCGGAIDRLAKTVLAGADHPQIFEEAAGAPQNSVLGDGAALPKTLWGWLAIYARHTSLPQTWRQRLANSPRLAAAETGGDEITLYLYHKGA